MIHRSDAIFVLCFLSSAVFGFTVGYAHRGQELTPTNGKCTAIAEHDGWTPVLEYELGFLKDMSHRTETSLKCSADVAGHLVYFPADQIFVQRYAIKQPIPPLIHTH